jgi:hypothetical protein
MPGLSTGVRHSLPDDRLSWSIQEHGDVVERIFGLPTGSGMLCEFVEYRQGNVEVEFAMDTRQVPEAQTCKAPDAAARVFRKPHAVPLHPTPIGIMESDTEERPVDGEVVIPREYRLCFLP